MHLQLGQRPRLKSKRGINYVLSLKLKRNDNKRLDYVTTYILYILTGGVYVQNEMYVLYRPVATIFTFALDFVISLVFAL